jgi:hypothetical protein
MSSSANHLFRLGGLALGLSWLGCEGPRDAIEADVDRVELDAAVVDPLDVGLAVDAPRPDAPRPDTGPPGPGPLMDLPSAPGPHVAAITALGADAWLRLPDTTPDAEWGTAPGRSWGGAAFAAAPDLGGAFFTGEGPHAHVWRDGHAMDDVWFYDLNANRWITIHPGTDTTTFSSRVEQRAPARRRAPGGRRPR